MIFSIRVGITSTMALSTPKYILGCSATQPEGTHVEYKRGFNHDVPQCVQMYKKIICAFANTQGGKLVFGVEDKGIIRGVNYNYEMFDKYTQKINEWAKLDPIVLIQTTIHQIAYNLCVIEVDIPKSEVEVFVCKTSYIRQNGSCIKKEDRKFLTHEQYTNLCEKLDALRDSTTEYENDVKRREHVLNTQIHQVRTMTKALEAEKELFDKTVEKQILDRKRQIEKDLEDYKKKRVINALCSYLPCLF